MYQQQTSPVVMSSGHRAYSAITGVMDYGSK